VRDPGERAPDLLWLQHQPTFLRLSSMRHLDLLSRLTGRALKDVCLHHRTSRYATDSSGIAGVYRHPDAG
jgi:hypothetical protein